VLDLRRLQILSALEAEGTMTAAAEVLFMTTSAVSQQLSLLEREAGVPLVARSGRRVRLTEAGLVLVRHAHQISAAAEAAETSMKRFRTDVAGVVSLSAFPSFAGTILPPALQALAVSYPDLRVTVSDLEPFQSVAELRAGRIDLAVIDNLHPVPTEGMIKTLLYEDELIICLPPSYKDLPRGPVGISTLSTANWIMDVRQSVFEIFVRNLCIEQGFEPKVVANCSNLAVTLALVEAGVGVAVLSKMHAIRKSFNIASRSITPSPRRDIILAYRAASQDSPLVAAVAAELKEKALQWRTTK
jgi:DNA-binding transcriptional LysR family regulator